MLNIKILTAYPEIFPGALSYSIIGNALKDKKWSLDIVNLHDFGYGKRKSIDDIPFGGGPGMIIRPDVVEKALLSLGNLEESFGLGSIIIHVLRNHKRGGGAWGVGK